ncbi:hypothetical protein SAMN00017405_0083 [Desulfonispora thiosulfatigenes DSM 11270]|uniref:Uncharacterized protein n=1 Tax=Desulfonispora thiosulfatigenes DSM 11270 TaxID=656914 RepID=A0A1W1VK56_DESTI|nr:hypothetical protein [Desulfonispora thiosulfatigenes]SMB93718.1 hypothetical protein SAMN00017405_0083 [Desulfonispora thiosulfatigenes DSM 11270]
MNELDKILKFIYSFFSDINYVENNNLIYEFNNDNLNLNKKDDKVIGLNILKKIQNLIPEFKVIDWTDLEDTRCYEFRILLNKVENILDDDNDLLKVLGGKRQDLYLFISRIANYYYMYIEDTEFNEDTGELKFTKNISFDKYSLDIKNKLEMLMNDLGYIRLDDEVAKTVILNVETEYLEKNKVKIFNCLFTEFDELYEKKIVQRVLNNK